jgi:hypothetical protein
MDRMIKDDALASRLNAVKKGEEIPAPPVEEVYYRKEAEPKINEELTAEYEYQPRPGMIFMGSLLNTIESLGMSMLFGVGLKAIFSTQWKFWGILGVGVIVYEVFNLIKRSKLFS